MDTFVSRKRRKTTASEAEVLEQLCDEKDEDSTDLKLAILSSLHPERDQVTLLESLIACNGSVEEVLASFATESTGSYRKNAAVADIQSSLPFATSSVRAGNTQSSLGRLTRKGQTLYLYSPDDIARNTPCSIIHNFLPAAEADALLRELLAEAPTYGRLSFKVFDNVVQSPHSSCFYVSSSSEKEAQQKEYIYNGAAINDVRLLTPEMRKVSDKVQEAVNREVASRIKDFYPDGRKLQYQSPHEWKPNAAFVNCYNGGAESVGYHSDQLTYLGPRAIIGSISLGVAREFRVRKVAARDQEDLDGSSSRADVVGQAKAREADTKRANAEGQISIHLPHNSLLVMHAEMQEEWKHSIAPARTITPHPIAGNKRINITYRWYREELHPKYTPRCRCGVPTVLRCVQRKKETRGRYMYMCHAGLTGEEGKKGCAFFEWARFTDDGDPIWIRNDTNERQN
ncbi:MAG: hypothetical protein Q9227_001953 [Pyrenula ochraceoflavens]